MLIKKRWAWLTSVTLLGFLARADGHEGDSSLSVVEPSTLKSDPFPTIIALTEEQSIHDGKGEKLTSIEDELVHFKTYVEPEKDTKISSKEDTPTGPHSFPYAINSDPSIVEISAMLSYCVYNESHSATMCKEFWNKNCDKDALSHFKLGTLNVVTVCKNKDIVYVAFAGTQSLSDGIVDISILSRKMNFSREELFAHGGFNERSKEYSKWVKGTLKKIQGIGQKEIILTGHSLGAAQATLLAHDVYEGLELNIRGGVSNSLNQVKVIGYASPSVLLNPASYFLGHLNHLRFYNSNDPVATKFSRWMNYKHVGVQLEVLDESTRNIARAVPLLKKEDSLKLLHALPYSYWKSLPPLPRSPFNPGFDAHRIDSYTLTAVPAFEDYQKRRDTSHRSLTSLVNVEKVLKERVGAPVTCKLQNNKVICISKNQIIAKFRYALDAPPTGQEVDACMSSIVSTSFLPGLTMNAGITLEDKMSPMIAASEALVLDLSADDIWYGWMPSRMLASLYMDGASPFPVVCDRKATFLEPVRTLPNERSLIRKYLNSAPRLFTVTKSHTVPANETVKLIQEDDDFFSDKMQDGWMDCRLPENDVFCPAHCMDNQACAVMKKWGSDGGGSNYWVSLSKSSGLKWGSDNNSWKHTIIKKGNSWFPIWRTQATFMVVRDCHDDYLQYSG